MISLGPHAAFIIAAYSVALCVVAALIAWVVIDYRIQQRTLAALESRGVVRRSASLQPTRIRETA